MVWRRSARGRVEMSLKAYLGCAAVALAAALGLAAPASGKETLSFWTQIGPGPENLRTRAMSAVIDGFKAKYPDIDVVPTTMPWNQLSPTLLRASKAGQVPDVAMLFSPHMPVHIAAKTLTPLDGYMASWSPEARSDIVILQQQRDKAGTVFGLPYEMRLSGFVYRRDLLQAMKRSPPRDLNELVAQADEAAKADVVGLALGFSPEQPTIAGGWFLSTLRGMGAKVLNEDGTAAFVSPEAEKLVGWVAGVVRDHKPVLPLNVALNGLEAAQQLFIARKAVFLPASTQRFEFIRDRSKLGDDVQITTYLTFDPERPAPALVQNWSLVIPKGAKSPDAAWKFIEYWTSAAVQSDQAKMAGYVPVRRSALDDPFFATAFAENIRWAVDYAAKYPMDFEFPENTELLYDIWAKMFGQVLTGRMAPREALVAAEADYNRAIRRSAPAQ